MPACAKACPTESIQFGPLDELRDRAHQRVEALHDAGRPEARLYGADPADGIGGAGAMFLLLDEPEVYGLPPDPVVTTRDLPRMWRHAARRCRQPCCHGRGRRRGRPGMTAGTGRRRRGGGEKAMVPDAKFSSYYGRPVIKETVWGPDIPAYLFLGGLAGASSTLAAGAHLTGHAELARAAKAGAAGAISLSMVALIHDLGRPLRFVNMLRVLKVTSPMSVGTWILSGYTPMALAAAAAAVTGKLPRTGLAATLAAAALGPAVASYTAYYSATPPPRPGTTLTASCPSSSSDPRPWPRAASAC